MAEKVLCPWCGMEMRIVLDLVQTPYGEDIAWCGHAQCPNWACQAEGPFMQIPAFEDEEKVDEAARAVTLCRYTPPIKPMTLEEVLATDAETFMETNGDYGVWACRCFVNMHDKAVIARYIYRAEDIHRFADYGKTWRCWERKPTDEERRAAEWET